MQVRIYFNRFKDFLSEPVHGYSIALVRIFLGFMFVYKVVKFWREDAIRTRFIEPIFKFKYLGFDWVGLSGEAQYYALFVFIAFSGFCLGLGLFTKLAAFFCFVSFSIIFFDDASYYLNHYYFLLSLILVFIPIDSNRVWSLDKKIFDLKGDFVPRWNVFLVIFTMGIVYTYGGIAKIDSDWLQGIPLHVWVYPKETALSFLNDLYKFKGVAVLMAWSGFLIDLFAVPGLLWRKTRLVYFFVLFLFHSINSLTFNIGVFPIASFVITTSFFDPRWPKNCLDKILGKTSTDTKMKTKPIGNLAFGLILFYIAYHCLMPFRHHLYPGYVGWTEEAHYFSWRMMLRSKKGKVPRYIIKDKNTDREWQYDIKKILTDRQISEVSTNPNFVVQLSQHIKKLYETRGLKNISIRVDSMASYNYRPFMQIIDSSRDISNDRETLFSAPYINRDYSLDLKPTYFLKMNKK